MIVGLIVGLLALAGPASPASADPCSGASDDWLESRMRAAGGFEAVLGDPSGHRLQILVSEVVKGPDGATTLVRHGYRVGAEYIYPASAIKTFASVAALRSLAAARPVVDLDTPLVLCGARRCGGSRDRSNREGGKRTLGHEIRKMQIVSDNGAFNRLYDYVGHREINAQMAAMGFSTVRIVHRLSTNEGPAAHRRTPRMQLRPGRQIVEVPARDSEALPLPPPEPGLQVGRAHIGLDDARVAAPMDFTGRNTASLCALQQLSVALVAPGLGTVELGLSEAQRELLLAAMTVDPRASKNPSFTDPTQSAERFKPLLPGITRVLPRAQIRYVNKAGKAYGFHVENAYIEDLSGGRAFFVSAAIYADQDGTVGDDRYDYAEITAPFFTALGELLARALLVR